MSCDLPEANELVVHILAAVAQAERKAISDRTKAALAAARARGTRLGNPKLKPGTRESALRANRAHSALALARATELRDIVEHARKCGLTSLRQLSDHLNEMGIASSMGGRWHPNSVRRVCLRLNT